MKEGRSPPLLQAAPQNEGYIVSAYSPCRLVWRVWCSVGAVFVRWRSVMTALHLPRGWCGSLSLWLTPGASVGPVWSGIHQSLPLRSCTLKCFCNLKLPPAHRLSSAAESEEEDASAPFSPGVPFSFSRYLSSLAIGSVTFFGGDLFWRRCGRKQAVCVR